MQEYSRMLLLPTPLQQPTGPLQPCLRALLVSARPLIMSARPLLVSAPWMPDVRRLLSVSPVLLCQRARPPSTRIKKGGSRKLFFSGHYAGFQGDAVAPHSTTAAHRTAPALAARAAQSGPSDARSVGLGRSRARTAASASDPIGQDDSSGLAGP